jgi:hypothetical protein
MTIVRRTLVPIQIKEYGRFPHCGTAQIKGLVQVLGKGLVRTALWAVRSTGRWSGRGWPRSPSQFRNWQILLQKSVEIGL